MIIIKVENALTIMKRTLGLVGRPFDMRFGIIEFKTKFSRQLIIIILFIFINNILVKKVK